MAIERNTDVKTYDEDASKLAIETDLARLAAEWRAEARLGVDDPLEAYLEILLRGGKRLRGVLAMQSYYAHGGHDEVVALTAARVYELVQAYLLVLDDIADNSDTRRGGPSAHRLIEQHARQAGMRGDLAHYGRSQAMHAAVQAMHRATLELAGLDIDDATARRSLMSLHKAINTTATGQIADMYHEVASTVPDEATIEDTLIKKTAYYTILGPLELGACLAGSAELDPVLCRYALHAGCAFQIANDIAGVFGDTSTTGKSPNDDIREGKMTLLVHHAHRHGTPDEARQMSQILGKHDASQAECDMLRDIMRRTGALDYAWQRVDYHHQLAREELGRARANDTFIAYLGRVVDDITKRR